ncbi:Flp family type IVb pilin [Cereibacter changlensis]|uniref:Flp family type IVb pilin n=1 Tax=Cereibacter changlensis TaxID=402884 RepID=UPI0040334ABD
MTLLNIFKKFHNDESGAVTVDWVVLTAAIVGLGLVVMSTVSDGLGTAADTISEDLADIETGVPAPVTGSGTGS